MNDRPTVKLVLGDCLEALKGMEPGGVDAVVMDPPYGVELSGKRSQRGHGRSGSSFRPGTYAFPDTPEYIRDLVVPVVKQSMRIAKCVLVTPGTRNMWLYPQPADVGGFYAPAGPGSGPWGFRCFHPVLFYGACPYLASSLGARPNATVMKWGNDANKVEHPCAKPLEMMRWMVERASLPGMTVIDPFMGSGTTGVACVRTGRNFIGIEIDPSYHAIARKRIAAEQDKTALFDSVGARE